MTYICTDCGHIFEEGEEGIREEHHPYGSTTAIERIGVCPICGGDFEEAGICKHCGGAFYEGSLVGGYYCGDCLKEALTFDSFLDFATYADHGLESSDVHMIEHFMLVCVYGLNDDYINGSSNEFRSLMMAEFKDAVAAHNRATRFGADDKFLEQVWQYMEDYKLLGDFAEYLHDKEVKK